MSAIPAENVPAHVWRVSDALAFIASSWCIPLERLVLAVTRTSLVNLDTAYESIAEVRSPDDRARWGVHDPHRAFVIELTERTLVVKLLTYDSEERRGSWIFTQMFPREHRANSGSGSRAVRAAPNNVHPFPRRDRR